MSGGELEMQIAKAEAERAEAFAAFRSFALEEGLLTREERARKEAALRRLNSAHRRLDELRGSVPVESLASVDLRVDGRHGRRLRLRVLRYQTKAGQGSVAQWAGIWWPLRAESHPSVHPYINVSEDLYTGIYGAEEGSK